MVVNIKEIERSVKHSPKLIKFLYQNNQNKGYITRILNKLVPFKVGIEFELFGSVVHGLGSNKTFDYLKTKLNLTDYSEDFTNYSEANEQKGQLNEIRVCINGYHQLTGLFEICKLLNNYCKIPQERGGIHIHIDFNKPIKEIHNAPEFAQKWFSDSKIQSRVLEIFGGYKGTYNVPGCGLKSKGKYINVSRLNTIEFRIGSLTFDYNKIIYYIVELSKLVKKCHNDLYNQGGKCREVILETASSGENEVTELYTPTNCTPDDYRRSSYITFNDISGYGYYNLISNYTTDSSINSITC